MYHVYQASESATPSTIYTQYTKLSDMANARAAEANLHTPNFLINSYLPNLNIIYSQKCRLTDNS
jgi:hypothetical protein